MYINVYPPGRKKSRGKVLDKLIGEKSVNWRRLAKSQVEEFFGVKVDSDGVVRNSNHHQMLLSFSSAAMRFSFFRPEEVFLLAQFIQKHYAGQQSVSLQFSGGAATVVDGVMTSLVWKNQEIYKGVFDSFDGVKTRAMLI